MMEVLKRPRLSYYQEDSEDKHSELLIHSLLNFSDNNNSFDSTFRVHKKPHISLDNGIKLAPIKSISDGIFPFGSECADNSRPISGTFRRQELSSPSYTSSKSDSVSDLQTNASLALVDLPYSHSVQVLTQPVGFQIANYNIHPPPALAVDRAITQNITIHAQLVENEKRTVVDGGFQSGDVRVLRAGHTTLYFTGLKLNKMGPIKTELHFRDYKRIPTTFCIQFKIGNRIIYSDPFKLVSSCAQLPQEVRDVVRPTKKTSRSDSPEREDVTPSSSPNYSTVDVGETTLRRTLEIAIQAADMEGAASAARKLAYLRKIKG